MNWMLWKKNIEILFKILIKSEKLRIKNERKREREKRKCEDIGSYIAINSKLVFA